MGARASAAAPASATVEPSPTTAASLPSDSLPLTRPAVVDSHTFIADYSSRASLAARPDLGEGGSLRPVVDLLVEQIECVPLLPRRCCTAPLPCPGAP